MESACSDRGDNSEEEMKTKDRKKITGYLRMVAKKSKAGFGRVHDELSRRCADFLKSTPPSSPKTTRKPIDAEAEIKHQETATSPSTCSPGKPRDGDIRDHVTDCSQSEEHTDPVNKCEGKDNLELPECDWCFGQITFHGSRSGSRRHTIDLVSDHQEVLNDSEDDRFGGSTTVLHEPPGRKTKSKQVKSKHRKPKQKSSPLKHTGVPAAVGYIRMDFNKHRVYDLAKATEDASLVDSSVTVHSYENIAVDKDEGSNAHSYENMGEQIPDTPRPHRPASHSNSYICMENDTIDMPKACNMEDSPQEISYVNAPSKPRKSNKNCPRSKSQDEYVSMDNCEHALEVTPARRKTMQTGYRSPRTPRSNNTSIAITKSTTADHLKVRANTTAMEEFYSMSVEEVVRCLEECVLPTVASVCAKEGLDGEYFRHVTRADLRKAPFALDVFYVDKLFRVINGWRPKRSK